MLSVTVLQSLCQGMPSLFVLGLVRPSNTVIVLQSLCQCMPSLFVHGLARPSNTVSYSAAVTVSVHAQFVCPWSG